MIAVPALVDILRMSGVVCPASGQASEKEDRTPSLAVIAVSDQGHQHTLVHQSVWAERRALWLQCLHLLIEG